MMNFFDMIAPVYEGFHSGGQKTFNKIRSTVIFDPLDLVVDLGGGTGRIAKYLANKVQKITVVDASEKMLRQCLLRHRALSCVHAYAQNLPFADNSVNKVVVVDSFHHFRNQKQVVEEIRRILTKNGKVVIEEFNPLTVAGKMVAVMEKLFGMNSVFYPPLTLADLFSKDGFKVQLIDEDRASYYLIGEKI